MTRTASASTQVCYPAAAVCRVWKFPRATLYRNRSAYAMPARPSRRRGPQRPSPVVTVWVMSVPHI